MTSSIPLSLALAAGRSSPGSPSGDASGTSSAESSTGGDASSGTFGDERFGETADVATTTGEGTATGAGMTSTTGGETGTPEVDPCEDSLSSAGSVTFVTNGNDDPPSVAGLATIDLDPADDADLLQSMTAIEFRIPV